LASSVGELWGRAPPSLLPSSMTSAGSWSARQIELGVYLGSPRTALIGLRDGSSAGAGPQRGSDPLELPQI
jgi:hypothetical protein